jgi:hypothetical protein
MKCLGSRVSRENIVFARCPGGTVSQMERLLQLSVALNTVCQKGLIGLPAQQRTSNSRREGIVHQNVVRGPGPLGRRQKQIKPPQRPRHRSGQRVVSAWDPHLKMSIRPPAPEHRHVGTRITKNEGTRHKNGAVPTPKDRANHCLLYLLPQTPLREKINTCNLPVIFRNASVFLNIFYFLFFGG